jgi:hypothetical protein
MTTASMSAACVVGQAGRRQMSATMCCTLEEAFLVYKVPHNVPQAHTVSQSDPERHVQQQGHEVLRVNVGTKAVYTMNAMTRCQASTQGYAIHVSITHEQLMNALSRAQLMFTKSMSQLLCQPHNKT